MRAMWKTGKVKRAGSVLLVIILALAMNLSVLAETTGTVTSSDTDSNGNAVKGTITISNPQADTTYYAYKIFDVTYAYSYTYDEDEDEDSAKAEAASDTSLYAYAYSISTSSAWFDYISGRTASTDDETNEDDTESFSSYEGSYTNTSLGLTLTQSAADSSVYYVTRVEVEDEDGDTSYVSAATMASLLKEYVSGNSESISAEATKATSTTDSEGNTTSNLESDGSLVLSSDLDLGYYLVIGVTASTEEDGNAVTTTEALAELTTTNPTAEINDKNEIEHNKSYEVAESISGDTDEDSEESGTSADSVTEDASTAGTVVDADDTDDGDCEDDTSVEIGSVLRYTIEETVPDATGFDVYTYNVSDSMSQGLTFNDDVVISIYAAGSTGEAADLTLTLVKDTTTTKKSGQTAIYTVTNGKKTTDEDYVAYGTLIYTSKTFDGDSEDGSESVTLENGFTLTLDMTLLQDYVLGDLVITYSATVNVYASGQALANEATLTYTNDENVDDETKPSITDTETAYTSKVVIDKYVYDASDEAATSTKLAGAVFALYRVKGTYTDSDGNTVTVYLAEETDEDGAKTGNYCYTTTIDGTEYTVTLTENSNGDTYTGSYTRNSDESDTGSEKTVSSSITVTKEYYKYTYTTDSSDDTDSESTVTSGTSAVVSWVAESSLVDSESGGVDYTGGAITTVTTDENGAAAFNGLTDGVYYLLEVAAPDGYNLLSDSVEVVIDGDSNVEEDASAAYVLSYTKSIANATGTLLPSTGGIGTTIFYVAGVVLVAGAVVLLIVRRRRDMRQDA